MTGRAERCWAQKAKDRAARAKALAHLRTEKGKTGAGRLPPKVYSTKHTKFGRL